MPRSEPRTSIPPATRIRGDGGLWIVPVEALGRDGLRPDFAALLQAEAGFSEGWCALLDAAWSLYQERAAALHARCPREWFPPRRTNLCIATEPVSTRPYFQPIAGASWLLEACDFDPEGSGPELAACLMLYAERLGLVHDVTAAALQNLSYWLDRSAPEIDAFCAACETTPRSDAAGWRALAGLIPAIRRCRHPAWHGPAAGGPNALTVPGTSLRVPAELEASIERFARDWQRSARAVVARYTAAVRSDPSREIEALLRELVERAPAVLVASGPDRLLWDPERPARVAPLRAALARASGAAAVRDVRADLARAAERTRDFCAALSVPEELPPTTDLPLDTTGLAYLHPLRGRIVYDLAENEGRRLREPSPPLERWLLGARVLHEWGHAAAAAGWIGVPDRRGEAFAARRRELSAGLDAVLRDAPRAFREAAGDEIAGLAREAAAPGRALVERMLGRADDYCANLAVAAIAPAVERLTYVRNNVRSLVGQMPDRPFTRLARYLHELQYLRFAELADPLAWFLDSTWFREEYVSPGIVGETRLAELVAAAAALYDCFELDPRRFRPSRRGAPETDPGGDTPGGGRREGARPRISPGRGPSAAAASG